MSSYEAWDLRIAAIALFANFVAVAVVAFQLRLGRKASRAESLRLSRQATLDYYASTLDQRNRLQDGLPPHYDRAAIEAAMRCAAEDSEYGSKVARYLAYWELLASGVNLGIYDLDTVMTIARTRIIQTWEHWQPYIEARRNAIPNPRLYVELERLAERLRSQRVRQARFAGRRRT